MSAKRKYNPGSAAASWRISFLLLDHEQQKARIRQLSDAGWSDVSLGQLTGLGVHELRAILDPHYTDEEKPT